MNRNAPLVLASSSPRRQQLLQSAGFLFEICKPDVQEFVGPNESPIQMVERLAQSKAVVAKLTQPTDAVILSADTTVCIDGDILNKPQSAAEASMMLQKISGKKHEVFTGICFLSDQKQILQTFKTEVWIRTLSSAQIAAYIRTGEPMDKAGSYAAQGIGMSFITRINGSYTNVVGLPMTEVGALLGEAFGIWPQWMD